jgi:hypothetical protein
VTKAKVFFDREHGFGGGYVMGDGDLPEGFNPDEFITRFGQAIIRKCAPTDDELIEMYGEEHLGVMRQVADAMTQQAQTAVHRAVHTSIQQPIDAVGDVYRIMGLLE